MTVYYRNVSADVREVVVGHVGPRVIPPDGLLVVADEYAESYDCQPTIWDPVDQAAFDERESARKPVAPQENPPAPEVALLEAQADGEVAPPASEPVA